MSIQLKIDHVDDLRLRHQMAHKVERVQSKEGIGSGEVTSGTEWRFADEVERDRDPRRVDANGHPILLPHYTFHIAYGLKNVVIEKKGKVETLSFRNSSIRNQMRIKLQVLTVTGENKKGDAIKEWKDQTPQYVPPNTWTGVAVGDGLRAVCDEMPT
jgi:hypothetical protein